jgi:hypothetical protein
MFVTHKMRTARLFTQAVTDSETEACALQHQLLLFWVCDASCADPSLFWVWDPSCHIQLDFLDFAMAVLKGSALLLEQAIGQAMGSHTHSTTHTKLMLSSQQLKQKADAARKDPPAWLQVHRRGSEPWW